MFISEVLTYINQSIIRVLIQNTTNTGLFISLNALNNVQSSSQLTATSTGT